MIHRDVKPQNILLDEGFEAKLTDFDLVGAHDTTGGTRTGAMGTFIYAAPECLERPQEATARVDVFGLGMTAIFGLAGKPLTLSTLRNPEPMIAGLDCSSAVKEVLQRAVAWEPEARYADAGALVTALRAAMRAEMSTGPAMTPLLAEPIALGSPRPPSPGVPLAGGLLLESWFSAVGKQPREPVRSAGGVSSVDDAQNLPWAVEAGADTYGRWAAFEVNGARQRMRWIPPGS